MPLLNVTPTKVGVHASLHFRFWRWWVPRLTFGSGPVSGTNELRCQTRRD